MSSRDDRGRLDRRRFLQWSLVGAGLLVPAACGAGRQSDAGAPAPGPTPTPGPSPDPSPAQYGPYGPPPSAPPAPAGGAPATEACVPTEDNIQGPFFTAGAPSRAVLAEPGMKGTPFQVAGKVLDRDCRPITGARMEIWQADDAGAYDLKGWRLRGRLAPDQAGAWSVRTIIPGRYLNGPEYRPAHLHVKVAAPGYQPLTTQLYFEGDPYNDKDPWIRDSLIMKLARSADGLVSATFDFVLPPA